MKPIQYFLLTGLFLLGSACAESNRSVTEDFTNTLYTPSHASGFEIRGHKKKSSSLVIIRNPWQGDSSTEQHLLILRNGERRPAGFDGEAVHAPVQRVICMSASHVAQFDAIGECRRIVGVSGLDYITNPEIRNRARTREVADIGFDTNINFETLTSLRPDLILLYGISGEDNILTGKLRELGIPYIYIGDYVEESPLGKAEWLVLAAELCDRRPAGIDTLRRIVRDYERLKVPVRNDRPRPRVMLNTPYRDTWFLPPSQSYMVRLIEDAGGNYIYTRNHSKRSVAVDMEEAYLLANRADFWLNVGMCNNLTELRNLHPKFESIPAVEKGRVYNNNLRQTPAGGSDFWESGTVHPDWVLHDLKAILSGDEAPLYYYKRLE